MTLASLGTPATIDIGATGTPITLRTAVAPNGDAFVVWLADTGGRNDLWANRYNAQSASWGTAQNIEVSSAQIDTAELTVDGSGNAIVVWHEVMPGAAGAVFSVRYEAGTGGWALPYRLSDDGLMPQVASDASGNVLAVWAGSQLIRGRLFDAAARLWLPEELIEQNLTGTGASQVPVAALDAQGNALAAWRNGRASATLLASNFYPRATRRWNSLPPGDPGPLGTVPGSLRVGGTATALQLKPLGSDGFLLVWQGAQFGTPDAPLNPEVMAARFATGTQSWSTAQVIVPRGAAGDVALQSMTTSASGAAVVLWTQSQGARNALNALHLPAGSATWTAGREIDSAVGGGATNADVAFAADGTALAVWQQFEGGRPNDGSRSNIAANRYDLATDRWTSAILAEAQPGNASGPRVSAAAGSVIAWIQRDGSATHILALRP